MRDLDSGRLAVGFFDGVHKGHQLILSQADTALTFRNHPLSVLAPARAPRLIMSIEDRLAAIRACGVKGIIALEFTSELAQMEPAAFCAAYLKSRFVLCGPNWNFGRGGAGTAAFLRDQGYGVTVVPYAEVEGAPISSSRIRTAIESGQLKTANEMLGHPFSVRGVCFSGKHVGRALGYPTVNLQLKKVALQLPYGVYAVEVAGEKAIANYGLAPTMGAEAWREPVLEVHFLSPTVPANLTDTPVVELLDFLRPERTFNSLDELKAQIALDCSRIKP